MGKRRDKSHVESQEATSVDLSVGANKEISKDAAWLRDFLSVAANGVRSERQACGAPDTFRKVPFNR